MTHILFFLSLDNAIKQAGVIQVTFVEHETIMAVITVSLLLLQCLANSYHPSNYTSLITLTSNHLRFLLHQLPCYLFNVDRTGGRSGDATKVLGSEPLPCKERLQGQDWLNWKKRQLQRHAATAPVLAGQGWRRQIQAFHSSTWREGEATEQAETWGGSGWK